MNNSIENNTDTLPTNQQVSDETINILFFKARTHNSWLDRPVTDALLSRLYKNMKWGPPEQIPVRHGSSFLESRRQKDA